jgi:hypothetical protein
MRPSVYPDGTSGASVIGVIAYPHGVLASKKFIRIKK